MAVMCALLGFIPERRWLRHADKELAGRFPRTIGLSGSNKRARKTFFLFSHMIGCWPWTPLYGATTSVGRGFHPGAVQLFPGDGQAQ